MKLHFFFYISLVQSCGRFVFIGEKHIALFGHVIQIMTTPHQELCLYKCLETSQCMSVNKYENESGVFYCELNKSGKEASPNDLKPRPGFVYLQTVVSLRACYSISVINTFLFQLVGNEFENESNVLLVNVSWLDCCQYESYRLM